MTLLDRLHELAAKLGISPKVLDPFVAAVVAIVVNWIVVGEPFDFEGLKTAGLLLLLGVVGVAAPPALGHDQEPLNERAVAEGRSRRRRP